MRELLKQIEEAGSHIQVDWSPARADAVRAEIGRKRARRVRTQLVLAAAACLAVVIVAVAGWRLVRPQVEPAAGLAPPTAQPVEGSVVLADGTQAVPLDRASEVRTLRVTPERVILELVRGGAKFTVTPDAKRTVVVAAGDVNVEVLGTVFTVERLAERTRVAVDRGHVRVSWAGGSQSLQAGQSGTFPPAEVPVELDLDEDIVDAGARAVPSARPQLPTVPSASSPAPEPPSWRALAKEGDHAEAYEALKKEGPNAVRDRAEDLMLAADVARLSGHAGEAVVYLRGVVSRHGGDPRAPLAAFTLGRVLLDELGRPSAASAAFADAQRLAPGGALAQDALAREIEALAKAGQTVAAHDRALQYVERYPSGRRIKAVRRYGGLE